ncbi:MAG: serine hydrolase [Pseudomonadota bacterium]
MKRAMIAAALALAAGAVYWIDLKAQRIGFAMSKMVCSEMFVAGRSFEDLAANDLPFLSPATKHLSINIDEATRSVSVSIFGLGKTEMSHHPVLGCADKTARARLAAIPLDSSTVRPHAFEDVSERFPVTNKLVSSAMKDQEQTRHRAIVVLYKGELVAEHYAPGFDASVRFWSHSMAKSVNATLLSIADQQGLLSLDGGALVPEWGANDKRSRITHRHLTDMASGLDFQEDYELFFGDFFEMMLAGDTGHFAAGLDLAHTPGERWFYSSADSNLAARALALALGQQGTSTQAFAHRHLFAPLGITSAVLEFDTAGTFVGSSFMYATAMDWARLGQAYLQNGQWQGQQIIPRAWVEGIQMPLASSAGTYRHGMWLNRQEPEGRWPNLPPDTFNFDGNQAQYVAVIPSMDIVIARLGQTQPKYWRDVRRFLGELALSVTAEAAPQDALARARK